MSAVGRIAGSSAIVRTPSRGRRAIRTTFAPKGTSRASTAAPIEPAPSSTTVASTRSDPVSDSSRQWALRWPSMCSARRRWDARMTMRTHSATATSCTPAASHRIAPGGTRPMIQSTPAEKAWITRSPSMCEA